MKSWPKPACHCGEYLAASEIVFRFSLRASSPRTRIANVLSKPRGGLTSTLNCSRVLAFDLIVDGSGIGDGLMMKNRRESCAGVFGIEIDLTGRQRRVRQVSSEIETADPPSTFLASSICATISASRIDSVKSFEPTTTRSRPSEASAAETLHGRITHRERRRQQAQSKPLRAVVSEIAAYATRLGQIVFRST